MHLIFLLMCIALYAAATSIFLIWVSFVSRCIVVGFIAISVWSGWVLYALAHSESFGVLPVKVDYVSAFDFVHWGGVETISNAFLSLAVGVSLGMHLRLWLIDLQPMNFHVMPWMPDYRLSGLLFLFFSDDGEGKHRRSMQFDKISNIIIRFIDESWQIDMSLFDSFCQLAAHHITFLRCMETQLWQKLFHILIRNSHACHG